MDRPKRPANEGVTAVLVCRLRGGRAAMREGWRLGGNPAAQGRGTVCRRHTWRAGVAECAWLRARCPYLLALNAPAAHILSPAIGGHNHRTCGTMCSHSSPSPSTDPASDSCQAGAYLCASRAKRHASLPLHRDRQLPPKYCRWRAHDSGSKFRMKRAKMA